MSKTVDWHDIAWSAMNEIIKKSSGKIKIIDTDYGGDEYIFVTARYNDFELKGTITSDKYGHPIFTIRRVNGVRIDAEYIDFINANKAYDELDKLLGNTVFGIPRSFIEAILNNITDECKKVFDIIKADYKRIGNSNNIDDFFISIDVAFNNSNNSNNNEVIINFINTVIDNLIRRTKKFRVDYENNSHGPLFIINPLFEIDKYKAVNAANDFHITSFDNYHVLPKDFLRISKNINRQFINNMQGVQKYLSQKQNFINTHIVIFLDTTENYKIESYAKKVRSYLRDAAKNNNGYVAVFYNDTKL